VPIGKFEAFFGIFHASNWLYELKPIGISLVWMHIVHLMCSWTHLGL
jgi:hypothetical protein